VSLARRCAAALAGAFVVLAIGCGKKGPPLPPLVRLPAAPAEVRADRRGNAVDISLVLPSANTDGSRPANVERVDVYALDGSAPLSDNEVMKVGTRVGTVAVKAPRDPNKTIDADDPDSDMEPLEGPGLDQGAVAHVRDLLGEAPDSATTRTYVGVGISTRGRRGPLSKVAAVPLAPAPPTPAPAVMTYDETAVTVSWQPVPPGEVSDDSLAYNVYDMSPAAEGTQSSSGSAQDNRLTETAVADTTFVDRRVAWNVTRCYAIRAVRRVDDLSVEGDASQPRCEVLKDTFAPAPPSGLTAVASEGTISLIWTPNQESDLAGYRVLRAAAPSADLLAVSDGIIAASTFTDRVEPGVRYLYAVQAVDNVGNVSAASVYVEETAR
jgi:hypothetical protein